jgi:hypothetical protein
MGRGDAVGGRKFARVSSRKEWKEWKKVCEGRMEGICS